MSARQDDDRRIAKIWVATMQLKRKLAVSGLTRESFVASRGDFEQLLVDGLCHGLERIVEECYGLSFHLKSCYPDVPWDQIAGMRSRLAHDFPPTSLDLVWSVLTTEADRLLDVCEDYCERTGITPAELVLAHPRDVPQDPGLTDA